MSLPHQELIVYHHSQLSALSKQVFVVFLFPTRLAPTAFRWAELGRSGLGGVVTPGWVWNMRVSPWVRMRNGLAWSINLSRLRGSYLPREQGLGETRGHSPVR